MLNKEGHGYDLCPVLTRRISSPLSISQSNFLVSTKMFNSKESSQAFAMFDDDNSGTISLEEMMMLISKIGGNLTEGEAVGLIRQT